MSTNISLNLSNRIQSVSENYMNCTDVTKIRFPCLSAVKSVYDFKRRLEQSSNKKVAAFYFQGECRESCCDRSETKSKALQKTFWKTWRNENRDI